MSGDARTVRPGEPVTYFSRDEVGMELPAWLKQVKAIPGGLVALVVRPKPGSAETVELPATHAEIDKLIRALKLARGR